MASFFLRHISHFPFLRFHYRCFCSAVVSSNNSGLVTRTKNPCLHSACFLRGQSDEIALGMGSRKLHPYTPTKCWFLILSNPMIQWSALKNRVFLVLPLKLNTLAISGNYHWFVPFLSSSTKTNWFASTSRNFVLATRQLRYVWPTGRLSIAIGNNRAFSAISLSPSFSFLSFVSLFSSC